MKLAVILLTAFIPAAVYAQAVVEGTRLSVSNATIPIDVLVESPAQAPGELQVICLFQSVPENTLQASLAVLDSRLDGLLTSIRSTGLFRGDLGETLLVTPKPGAIAANRLLIVGLGDRASFIPEREELIGEIVYAESERLGVPAPTFAPTVLDGGKTGMDTAAVGAAFLKGFLRGRDLALKLHAASQGPAPRIAHLTFLAGTTHAIDTRNGLAAQSPTQSRKS